MNIVKENQIVYSQRIRAGRRTYFIDVKPTRADDYYISITESKRCYRDDGDGFYYEKHKILLYKEDFNKVAEGLQQVIQHVKQELMPDYDFEAFDNPDDDYEQQQPEKTPSFKSKKPQEDKYDSFDEIRENLKW
ncbi:MAG: DUF3276 family protein [Bernardetiaceae bacterium]|nr:DUF3276 family protein [Bernardetiaceae bacterium]